MIHYVLDTDTASLYRAGHPEVTDGVLQHSVDELAVTIITVEEMLAGWYRKLREKNTPERLEAIYGQMTRTILFLRPIHVLSYTVAAHSRFLELESMKLNVGAYDLRIASIVLNAGAVLVTRNRRDFERVPGLVLDDWS